MCGIAGYLQWNTANLSDSEMRVMVTQMVNVLHHRGPDDGGAWVDASAGVALGHRRLAIQDLSTAGHQPMVSHSGRFVIVLNGEIYNHLELRVLLDDSRKQCASSIHLWQGHSDTETFLAAIEAWGIDEALNRCIGMFAFALWDRESSTLFLARDRFGEKPLYYGWIGKGRSQVFAFASELKAFREYPGFDNIISRQALAQYIQFAYVPTPLSIYAGIYKLKAGGMITISHLSECLESNLKLGNDMSSSCYQFDNAYQIKHTTWFSFTNLVTSSEHNLINDEDQAIKELEDCLSQAVKSQSKADVPLGIFLSGGVDSSTIAALMQKQTKEPIKTFTIGFNEKGFDESPYALAIAKHLGTEHTEMRVTAEMAQEVIMELPLMYDEPFADPSQIPTHLVCRAARRDVTVALTGDGGDELFAGYNRYFWGARIWNRVGWLPFFMRKALGSVIHFVPISVWNLMSPLINVSHLGDKAHKLAARLKTVRTMENLYCSLVTVWQEVEGVVVDFRQCESAKSQWQFNIEESLGAVTHRDFESAALMMHCDTLTYLSDDILCKVDRAAMACSLETRVPFLDHRVAEFAWRLPLDMKIRNNFGKWALRQVLYKHVPKELIERPKVGFAIPLCEWLRGPLKDWAQKLLDPSRLKAEGYFYPETIHKVWSEHLSGKRDHTSKLWVVLMFQAWLEHSSSPKMATKSS